MGGPGYEEDCTAGPADRSAGTGPNEDGGRGIADKVVNGSFVAALVSVGLTAYFLYWPPV
jgi:hypothetical protein